MNKENIYQVVFVQKPSLVCDIGIARSDVWSDGSKHATTKAINIRHHGRDNQPACDQYPLPDSNSQRTSHSHGDRKVHDLYKPKEKSILIVHGNKKSH